MRRPRSRALARGVAAALALALLGSCSSDAGEPETDGGGPAGDLELVPGLALQPDAAALSPDGSSLAVPCLDDLCLWNTGTGSLFVPSTGGDVVAWSSQQVLATSGFSDDGGSAIIVLIDPRTGEETPYPSGHAVAQAEDAVGTGISDLAFSPDGEILASSADDGTVRLWSVPDGEVGQELAELETESATPDALAFSPDGDRLAVAAPDAPVEIWDVASGERVVTLNAPPQGEVAWSPDGDLLATDTNAADDTATVTLWDTDTFEQSATYPEPVQADGLAFSPDGSTLALSQKDDDAVLLWPVAGGETRVLTGHEEPPRAVVWAPDGAALYSVAASDGVIRWDVDEGEMARRYPLPPE